MSFFCCFLFLLVVGGSLAQPSPSPSIYRPLDGVGNNINDPTLGSAGSKFRRGADDHFGQQFYSFWGLTPEFEDILLYCSELAKSEGRSYLDGGGADSFQTFHFWAFADPVYFCQNFLDPTDPGTPSFVTQQALDAAPVLPRVREVSNIVFSQRMKRSELFTNHLGTYMGQFITTDISNQARSFTNFGVYFYSKCDRFKDTLCECCEDPAADMSTCLTLGCEEETIRIASSNPTVTTADPRVQFNENTHFLDLSQIYGGSAAQLAGLRDPNDSAKMWLEATRFPIPPFFGDSFARGDTYGTTWDNRGDIRLNKVPPMKVLGDLFIMNHNRIVDKLEKQADWPDRDELFEEARRLNIAQYQDIVFREYLASVLGRPLEPYDTNADGLASQRGTREFYESSVDPSLDITFSTTAYRFGHTKVAAQLDRVDKFFDDSLFDDILVRDNYWNVSSVREYETAAEDIIRGLVSSRQLSTGGWASDDVRNFMFSDVAKGSDLMATNLFRGRESGIPPFNLLREVFGLAPYESCANLTDDDALLIRLEELYGPGEQCILRIDPFVAGVIEPHVEQAQVGETFWAIIFDQYTRLRNGDRFYYENQLSPEVASSVRSADPNGYNPHPLTDNELDFVYFTTLEQLFADNYADIDLGDLGSGIFFLRSRQLQTLVDSGTGEVASVDPQQAPPIFENFLELSPSYAIWWDVTDGVLQVRIQTGTTGWVGFGIEPDLNTMKNADIYFCRYFSNNDTAEITDRYALDVGPPALDTDLGGADNIIDFSVSQEDGQTICQFSRVIDTEDVYDKVIRDENMKTMFAYNPETDELKYHGPTRQSNIFINFFQKPPTDEVPEAVLIIMGILAALIILYCFFTIFSIATNEAHFRYMSPLFCQLICLGAIISASSVFTLLEQKPSEASCTAYPWLLGIGFMLLFGCLFAKTYRLWRLFTSRSLKATVIDNAFLIRIVLLFCAPMIIFLICWTAIEGFEVVHERTEHDEDQVHDICRSETVWWAVFVGMIGFVLTIGCLLTFLVRNLPPEFNDSEAIGFSMYNAFLMLAVGAAIGWGLEDHVAAVVSIQGFTVIFMVYFTVFVLFMPVLWAIYVTHAEPKTFKSTMDMRSGGGVNVSGLQGTGGGTSVDL
eukprot:CAMPEP_0201478382 /NCGR_PEP_ID=MMETSP0151_2-20130828/3237_1 /ASSEMBLY_ACC=CAM_ASM_000257 /TAXON_ID=200890 /ORGANISM="Paramoeba atlantica, Strain 621/1 / CCAP 1560/9" /LENGTH=1127 /DNA_ID=CAMNT_0047859443 /DNA_START=128 /DNA_END=3511 /DNA_ORIENTATION=+